MAPGEIYGRCTPIPELWSLPGAEFLFYHDGKTKVSITSKLNSSWVLEIEVYKLNRRVVRSCIDVLETRVLVGSSDEYVRIHTLARRSKEQEEEEAKKKTKKTKKEEKVEVEEMEEEEEDARPQLLVINKRLIPIEGTINW
ncbi:hypothetical protein WN51_11657 [Melipona quadrifasciata]|uniref:Uncharacterized protein n=1 Tax=Melipona quadrifasciata TaxID=166423 RepID=A0A0M9A4J5_9HYME|nr:hypothetical protein WN51_11657 [Melipona quadrifasciata]